MFPIHKMGKKEIVDYELLRYDNGEYEIKTELTSSSELMDKMFGKTIKQLRRQKTKAGEVSKDAIDYVTEFDVDDKYLGLINTALTDLFKAAARMAKAEYGEKLMASKCVSCKFKRSGGYWLIYPTLEGN